MKLYFTPGACSLSPHITLRETGLHFDLEEVDLRAKKLKAGSDYLAINPKGYVPALRLDDGSVLTEGAIMVQYLADLVPDRGLAPPVGTRDRLRLQELLHFIATELHKGSSPLYNPKATEDFKESLKERLIQRFGILESTLADKPFLLGDHFTVADGYAFYVLRAWQKNSKMELSRWPRLAAYYARLAQRPSIKDALATEGLSP